MPVPRPWVPFDHHGADSQRTMGRGLSCAVVDRPGYVRRSGVVFGALDTGEVTGAKLHHYVPQMLLRRFAEDPEARSPTLFRLDKKTGQTIRSSVRNEGAITHHNRLANVPGLAPTFIEDTLATSEGRAVEPIRKLIAGERLTMMERLDIAFFLYFQQQRTPRGRAWQVFGQEQAARLFMLQRLTDTEAARRFFADRGEAKTEAELEEWTAHARRQIENGELKIHAGHDREVMGMFLLADDVVPRIASDFTYLVVRATGRGRFITCDHPLAMYDSAAPADRGVGWLSSPRVEITLPLDPMTCLALLRGLPTEDFMPADDEVVLDLNLRTYASAEWTIFGPSQASVQDARRAARQQRGRVARLAPRAPRIHIAERFEDEPEPFAKRVIAAPGPARGRRPVPPRRAPRA